jgi:hypothetical protein
MSQIILDSANDLIQGDFDNATLSQRTRLQTSTVNATTGVYVVPNGTATSASVQISNAADPTNASKLVVATNGTTDTQIVSGANGSGSYLPLSFYTNNDIRLQVNNSGALGVRTGVGTVGFGTSGQVLTSGGPAAGVSWTTLSGYDGASTQLFTSPGSFSVPPGITKVKVTVIGGGGGGGAFVGPSNLGGGGGGSSGVNIQYVTGITPGASIPVTVGAGGTYAGGVGGTSSIGPFGPGGTVSQTGGSGGSNQSGGSGSAGGGYGFNGVRGQNGSPGPAGNGGSGAAIWSAPSDYTNVNAPTVTATYGNTINGLYLSTGGFGNTGSGAQAGTRGGGGGGGFAPINGVGAAGGAGLVIVEW